MTEDDHGLLNLLKSEESDASTFYTSELAQSQASAMDRYHARAYGDEAAGRSQVVTHDIEDTINWIMPALLRTFAPSDDLIACEDDGLDDGDETLKATAQYIGHVFYRQCGGEHIIHDLIFDGLLQKVGVLRTAWEEPKPSAPMIREGVSVEQLIRYSQDPEYQILEVSQDGDTDGGPPVMDAAADDVPPPEMAGPMPGLMAQPQQGSAPVGLMAGPPPMHGMPPGGQPMAPMAPQATPLQPAEPAPQFGQTFAVKLQRVPKAGKPLVETIQPENFLISSRARSIETAPYHGARFEVFLADLIGDYPDKAHELDPDGSHSSSAGDADELESDVRTMARFPDEQDTGARNNDDEYREKVWLKIEYVHCDFDRDNIVELRRVVRVGDIILENEVVEESEFTLWSPLRVSHRAIGRSLADTLLDIQKIRTVITRKAMDALSQTLTPRTFYNRKTAANDPTFVDQLLDHDVGAAIGVDGNPSEHVMIQTTPDVSAAAFQAIEYWDRRSEEASGVNRHAMGIQPQAITKTASGIENLQSAANSRVEQIARHIGTALEVAFGKLLRIIVRHAHEPAIFKVSGKRVQWDARRVSDGMTVSVHVGMTAESREKKMAYLNAISAKQEQILLQMGPANPLCGLGEYRNTLARMVTAMGERDPARYFKEIDPNWQPPEPGADPKVAEAQGKAQIAQAELQQKGQIAQADMQGRQQLQVAEFQHKTRLGEAQTQSEAQAQAQKMAMERELAVMRIESERQMAGEKAQREMELARFRLAEEMQLAREKMALERELALESLRMGALTKSDTGGDGDGFRNGGRLDA